MQTEANTSITAVTVSQIVRKDYRTAEVFKKWGINYCCGGELPLAEACALKGISVAPIEAELKEASKTVSLPNALQFNDWPVVFLVDYIIYVHHGYLKNVLPQLSQHFKSFVSGHSKKYPHLQEVEHTFSNLAEEVLEHTKKEEERIFPYVKQIANTFERKEIYGSLFVRTMRQPLSEVIRKEHSRITNLLITLRDKTNHYQFPPNACTNYQVIYHKLKEFDADMVQHKHLENNILFPKVLEMEKSLLQF